MPGKVSRPFNPSFTDFDGDVEGYLVSKGRFRKLKNGMTSAPAPEEIRKEMPTSWEEGEMSENKADVTIHIDETLDHSTLQNVVEGIRRIEGVDSVVFHDDKPHMIIVYYDPAGTDSVSIHKAVTDKGVHAELIGM